jgi:hypothetical protein
MTPFTCRRNARTLLSDAGPWASLATDRDRRFDRAQRTGPRRSLGSIADTIKGQGPLAAFSAGISMAL